MNSNARAKGTTFHSLVRSSFGFLYPVSFVGFIALVLIRDGRAELGAAVPFGLFGLAPIALILAWVLSRCFSDIVSEEGIYGHSFWGVRRFVRWQDVRQVRRFRALNLRFLRVYSSVDSAVTWIGSSWMHVPEFRREIERVSPSDSPIREFLA
jgi:hypothetical protein